MNHTVTQLKAATYVNPTDNPVALAGMDFDAALEQIIESDAKALKARDDYERTMMAVGRGIVLLHEAVIAKTRGTPRPQELGDFKRWMDYRGPEWFDLLARHGKTVEWATDKKRWDVNIEAAQNRRDAQIANQVQQSEKRKALIAHVNRPVLQHTPSSPPPRTIGASKTVSAARLTTEYVRIDRLIARVDEEDRAEALEILETCFASLKELVGA